MNGLEHSLWINGFSPAWSSRFFQTEWNFLNHTYCTVINYPLTFRNNLSEFELQLGYNFHIRADTIEKCTN